MTTAVVFAYHDVGVRCLEALLGTGVRVPLVLTHADDGGENIWFDSVAAAARRYQIEVAMPEDVATDAWLSRLQAIDPDFIFSFYYRRMLPAAVLRTARRGAFNMHGSLLPRYRGRVPINWAVLQGERETGATLHAMVEKPDAGDIVDQMAVPIHRNDTAGEVFKKVTVAAEIILTRSVPRLVKGDAHLVPQDLSRGSYFGARRPEDGRIDWSVNAWNVHNLVRAVAPPYPGAFSTLAGRELRLLRTWWRGHRTDIHGRPAMYAEGDRLAVRCVDGIELDVVDAQWNGSRLDADAFTREFGASLVPLPAGR